MLLVIILAPPWILLAKPLILKQRHEAADLRKKQNGGDFEMKKVVVAGQQANIKAGSGEIRPG